MVLALIIAVGVIYFLKYKKKASVDVINDESEEKIEDLTDTV